MSCQHLGAGWADVDLAGRGAERMHQLERVLAGVRAGGEAGQGVGEHVGAGQPEPVHGARRDKQRLGRIQSAGNADDDALDAGRVQPLGQAVHLDVVGLVTACIAGGAGGGHVRKARDLALQQQAVAECIAAGQVQREGHPAHLAQTLALRLRRVAEAGRAQTLRCSRSRSMSALMSWSRPRKRSDSASI